MYAAFSWRGYLDSLRDAGSGRGPLKRVAQQAWPTRLGYLLSALER